MSERAFNLAGQVSLTTHWNFITWFDTLTFMSKNTVTVICLWRVGSIFIMENSKEYKRHNQRKNTPNIYLQCLCQPCWCLLQTSVHFDWNLFFKYVTEQLLGQVEFIFIFHWDLPSLLLLFFSLLYLFNLFVTVLVAVHVWSTDMYIFFL